MKYETIRNRIGDDRQYGAFFILYIMCAGLLFSASTQAEDLQQVYEQALDNDPEFLGSLHTQNAAKESLAQAKSSYLPNILLDVEHIETTQDVISSDNTVYQSGQTSFPTNSYTLKLTQPLFQWSSIVRIRQAEVESKRAEVEYFNARQDMILRVTERYLGVLAAQDQYSFSQAEKNAVKRQLTLANTRHRMGLARITDKLDAEARFALVDSTTIENRFALEDAYQILAESTGSTVAKLATLKTGIELQRPDPESLQEWIDRATSSNPDLIIQRHAVEIARHENDRQRAGHLPTVELVARQNYRDTDGTLFGGGSEVKNRDLLLRLSVPIYEGGYTSSRSRESAALFSKSRQDLEQTKRQVTRETTSAYYGVISAISKVQALKRALISQERALDAKRKGFKSGLNTNIQVLDAERDFYLAKKDYAQSRYDYLLNSLRLKKVTGSLVEQDLLAINSNWLQN
ncbi:MAG: TolC family outer membrane protein [Gammaproteobacteria bacterium]|nr:TolC family outer membrane protein [Gammaproteobacteria bacterium]